MDKIKIDQVVIGSCTNGRYSDLEAAAKVVKGKHVAKGVRAIVIPATQQIYLDALRSGLRYAGKYDKKILVEEFINGKEIEVAVMGNDNPMASICGEIDSGAEFYDYDAKYLTETSKAYIPARIPAEVEEVVRETAVKVYNAVGCQGLSRVDFFVTHDENRVVFNEINTLPGFTSISMYPKLFEASGIPYSQLIDELLRLAVEAFR